MPRAESFRALLRDLLQPRPGIHLTITLPTERSGPGAAANPTRLAALRGRAEEALREAGATPEDCVQRLAPVIALLDDTPFWAAPEEGLALFSAPGYFRALRLPFAVKQRVSAGPHFPLRSLLPLAGRQDRFYVLGVAEHDVRLLEVGEEGVRRLPGAAFPDRIERLLGFVRERSLQYHGSGRGAAIFHGSGEESTRHERDVRRFVAAIVSRAARQAEDLRAPVVLVSVAELHPVVADLWPDARLLDEAVAGSPDGLSDGELARRAIPVVARARSVRRQERARRWIELAGSGRATDEPQTVLVAAEQGRVERLFLADGRELWGSFDPQRGALDVHLEARAGDEDLIERATISTLGYGGEVECVPPEALATASPVVALLRY